MEKKKNIIDIHCHVAGLGYGDSGCFVSKKFKNSYKFSIYLKAMGVTRKELHKFGDSVIIEKLSRNIKESAYIKKAVILAMDGVVKDGELDNDSTEFYIPNEYIVKETLKHDNLLFGASINPYRHDAIERLDFVKKNGAVLIKWIPSIMEIDPSDKKISPFYEKMKELNLILLSHAGQERSFTGAKDEYCDPLKLELPLKLGLKVIAAHIATTGKSDGQDNFERIIPMFAQHPNLFADISSLTQINKLGFLVKALKIDQLKGRLLYGTDWPLQFFPVVSPLYQIKHLSFKQVFNIFNVKNKWDKDVLLKSFMGVTDDIFKRGEDLLNDFI